MSIYSPYKKKIWKDQPSNSLRYLIRYENNNGSYNYDSFNRHSEALQFFDRAELDVAELLDTRNGQLVKLVA